MLNGISIAASGLQNRSKAIDIAGNNIVNSETAGFKKDGVVTTTFGEQLAYRYTPGEDPVPIGTATYGSAAAEVYTVFAQGPLQETGRSVDMALAGDGFFTLQLADGSVALTRNGQFAVGEDGVLKAGNGALVMGQNGPITVGNSKFSVDSNGEVSVDGAAVDTLLIACPADKTTLVKLSDAMYQDPAAGTGGEAFTGKVVQGSIEASNVNVSDEMTSIIENSRSYQSCSQIVKMLDQILSKTVNEIGRL